MKKIDIKINKDDFKKKLDLKDGYTPIKGVDFFDGKDGKNGLDGLPGIPGTNGLDADENKIVQQVLDNIPKVEVEAIEIVQKLESLTGENRVDASAIKNLPEGGNFRGAAIRPLRYLPDVKFPTALSNGEVLKWNSTTGFWENATDSGGVTDHGALTGLADDDHPQYHNDARGDLRYSLLAHTHTLATGATDVTASASELNILDGATLSTTELNYVDGVTSAIQTQLNAKQATLVSGTNIKTINGSSLLGSGDLSVATTPGGSQYDIQLNDGSGGFIGSSVFTFDYSAGILNVNGGTLGNAFIRTGDNTVSFGDLDGAGNGTTLVLDDSTRTLTFTGSAIVGNLNGNATSANTATLASTVTVADAASDTTTFLMLAGSATGSLPVLTDAGLAYNASTNDLTLGNDLRLSTTTAALQFWNGSSYTKYFYGLASKNQAYIGGAGNTNANVSNNFAAGSGALGGVTWSAGSEGSYNVAIGLLAMAGSTTAHDNFALGAYSLWQNTTGSTNTAIGSNAMIVNTTGNFNVALGYQALGGSRTSLYNVAIGNQAGANYAFNGLNSNGLNTFIGALAGFGTNSPTIGTVTITIASPAVLTKTAHGLAAGDRVQFSTTGALPTGINPSAIYYVIAAGLTADAFEISTTSGGAAVNTSGSQSGTHTCYKVFSTGKQETFIGAQAGYDFTSGDNNTYIGYNTGRGVTTGSGNTVLGAQVTGLAATLTNNIILAIGTGATKLQFDATNWIVTGGAFLPSANDAVVLGAAGTAFSDLFLAEGGVINWDSGDVTITQTGNVLAFAGATTAYTFDAPVRLKNYTVATLPAGTQGDRAYVTDATAPTYLGALVGGGAVVCPVFYNGTAWVSA